jgi:DNA-nicking Smr family endonuclease
MTSEGNGSDRNNGAVVPPPQAPVDHPIDGTLDLHTFDPKEVRMLLPEYLAECRARGILEVRIIHGKGTGALRRLVHSVLNDLPEVKEVRPASGIHADWGSTIVTLMPLAEEGR